MLTDPYVDDDEDPSTDCRGEFDRRCAKKASDLHISEYKRFQSAPGPLTKARSVGRPLSIVNRLARDPVDRRGRAGAFADLSRQ